MVAVPLVLRVKLILVHFHGQLHLRQQGVDVGASNRLFEHRARTRKKGTKPVPYAGNGTWSAQVWLLRVWELRVWSFTKETGNVLREASPPVFSTEVGHPFSMKTPEPQLKLRAKEAEIQFFPTLRNACDSPWHC